MKVLNNFKWMAAAMLVAMTAACSDSDIATQDPVPTPGFNEKGEGFMAVSISLPSIDGTRAASTEPEYVDGELYEYEVKNATLLLFNGADEASAKLHSAYDISGTFPAANVNNQITTQRSIVQLANKNGLTGNIYAYVILNNQGLFTLEAQANNCSGTVYDSKAADLKVAVDGITDGSGSAVANGTSLTGKTFADFEKLMLTAQSSAKLLTGNTGATADYKNGFMMTTAPVASATAGSSFGGKIYRLAVVDPALIFPTLDQSQSSKPAATIYVERLVAKVQVNDKVTDATVTNNQTLTVKIDGFMVDQTAKSMYLSHNVGEGTAAATAFPTNIFNWAAYESNSNNLEALTANPYRFIEKTAINNGQTFNGTGEDPVYRIHWAIDPTYAKGTNDDEHSTLFNTVDAAQTIDTYLNAFADKNYVQAQPGKVVYALENTFGVDRMKDNQTTRVIIKAHYQKGGEDVKDFYTDSQTDAIFTEADFMKQVKSVVFKTPAVQNWFKANLAEGSAAAEGDKNLEVTLNYNGTSDKAAGIVTVASVTPKEDGATFKADKADFPAVAEINKQILNVFKYYLGGYAYYTVMIKHFGDAQTPWNNGETFTPNATRISYPYQNAGGKANGAFDTTAEQNYLGRYGMLRNTWYNVDVTGVSAIGQPTIPTVTPGTSGDGKDDDSVEMYIHTRIRILPWAKRSQSEVLH